MITTILLLPHADTRERLLAPGAPLWSPTWGYGWAGTIGGELLDRDHLVLARDGAEVYEGTDRMRRVLAAHVGVPTDTGGVVFHGAHADGYRDMRATNWTMHDWTSADCVQFYGDPDHRWSDDGPHKTIHVPALATPPWPAKPRHPLYTTWALGQVAQAQGLSTLVLLDADGKEVAP